LLLKLRAHGVDGKLNNWIEAWLTDRYQRVMINGVASSWQPILSGVPQGSVLGPLLFLIFINDLGADLACRLLMFADDTKLFARIQGLDDGLSLQHDLDSVSTWADIWQMKFNESKCKVMHFGSRNVNYQYSINNQQLQSTSSERDLGVTVLSSLKVAAHVTEAISKANRMLGLIKRSIRSREPFILLQLYKSFVRPHLEYCVSAWSPHYAKDKELIERVQHRFTRLFPSLLSLNYEQRLAELQLWSLEERRNRADLIEVFKMVRGISAVSWSVFFDKPLVESTRGHSWKFTKRQSAKDIRLHFFSNRVLNRWNALNQEAVDASTVNGFKHQLDKLRHLKMGFFKDSMSP
jgi:ribonucleases P/MRP protein subunit RPP40